MKMFLFIKDWLRKNNARASLFSLALSEGIKDMFTEMGYRFNKETER